MMKWEKMISKKQANYLFERAKEFNKIKPWQWLSDVDVFGIKFYDMDEIIFCSVLGNAGELNGMLMYQGVEGFKSFMDVFEHSYDFEEELIHIQKAIIMTFENRRSISNDDYTLIKKSDINFRGNRQWPTFRKYEPGFVPWFVSEQNLKDLPRILKEAYDCCLYFRENMDIVNMMNLGKCCVKNIYKDNNYEYSIINFDDILDSNKKYKPNSMIHNKLEIKRLKKQCKETEMIWEIDSFFHIYPIDDNEIPFFPAMLFIVETITEKIIGHHLTHPNKMNFEFQDYLVEMIKKNKILPKKIVLSNRSLWMKITDLMNSLGVKVQFVHKLKRIPKIKDDLFKFNISFH